MKTINNYIIEKLHLDKNIKVNVSSYDNPVECIKSYMDDFIHNYKDGKYEDIEYTVKKGTKYIDLTLTNVGRKTEIQLDERPIYRNPHPRVDKDDRSDLEKIIEDIFELLDKNKFNYGNYTPLCHPNKTEITFYKK